MGLTFNFAAVWPGLIGAVIGLLLGRRRLVRRYMTESAADRFALTRRERLRVDWTLARGISVDGARRPRRAGAELGGRRPARPPDRLRRAEAKNVTFAGDPGLAR